MCLHPCIIITVSNFFIHLTNSPHPPFFQSPTKIQMLNPFSLTPILFQHLYRITILWLIKSPAAKYFNNKQTRNKCLCTNHIFHHSWQFLHIFFPCTVIYKMCTPSTSHLFFFKPSVFKYFNNEQTWNECCSNPITHVSRINTFM